MSPPGSSRSAASAADPAVRIGALPDKALHKVLALLPAHEAVRTCVLAQRWRHLWRSAPGIRVAGVKGWRSVDRFAGFVDRLLILRRQSGAPDLDSCCFELDDGGDDDKFYSTDNLNLIAPSKMILLALRCNVRTLQFCATTEEFFSFDFDDVVLVSEHLTRIELGSLIIGGSVLDFSGCTALSDLKMDRCIIEAEKIASPSVKRVSMTYCDFSESGPARHTRISFPGVISLELTQCAGRTPLLETMPSLETAVVSFGGDCEDKCWFGGSGDCRLINCRGCLYYMVAPDSLETEDDLRYTTVLNGVSEATHLQLSAYPLSVFVFNRDIKWCPMFTNLKTLLLNEWCVAPDPNALISILHHSPNLEKLTLQLSNLVTINVVNEENGPFKSLEVPFTSDHLKLVQIKCEEIDERVPKILKVLSNYGIPLAHINIQQTIGCSGSRYCNFVCTGFSSN